MKLALEPIVQTVVRRIEKAEAFGHTLTLKVKFTDFTQITRSKTHSDYFDSYDKIVETSFELLEQIDWEEFPVGVRLLGVTCSNFDTEQEEKQMAGKQLTLQF